MFHVPCSGFPMRTGPPLFLGPQHPLLIAPFGGLGGKRGRQRARTSRSCGGGGDMSPAGKRCHATALQILRRLWTGVEFLRVCFAKGEGRQDCPMFGGVGCRRKGGGKPFLRWRGRIRTSCRPWAFARFGASPMGFFRVFANFFQEFCYLGYEIVGSRRPPCPKQPSHFQKAMARARTELRELSDFFRRSGVGFAIVSDD